MKKYSGSFTNVHTKRINGNRIKSTIALQLDNLKLQREIEALRRHLDNIKIRSYELGQKELHDMALAALIKEGK